MAEAARAHGIQVPAQCCSESVEDLLEWARRWGKWPVVVKPPESLASDDVRLCRSEAEIEAQFRRIVGKRNIAGVVNRGLIVQELMDATQYVVDTISYEGEHYLANVWRYGRPEFASDVLTALRTGSALPRAVGHLDWDALVYGAISSVSKELLPGDDDRARELFSYASKVLDAIGIRFGPCHFELMWTGDGIRLVEVGARVHGAPQTHTMSRMCIGTSQVDQTIDAYLHPSRFLANARRSYSLRWHGMMFRLTPWRCGVLQGFRNFKRIERLESFHGTFVMAPPGTKVPGCIGVVQLLHPDEEVLRSDCRAIREMENSDLFVIDERPLHEERPLQKEAHAHAD
jgi:biotin carboxylase